MTLLRFAEVAALGLGRLANPPADGLLARVHDDSRLARPGDLFVALNTGVSHVAEAEAQGAATLVPVAQEAALAALATLVRSRSGARVVAVVGSTGKTTTKDTLGGLCAAVTPTVWAERSRNNELGLPLTVLRLEPSTRVLVTEMGMRGRGQIAALCAIARPDVVLVTAVGPEHLALIGTEDDAARANAEAIEALPAGGIAVVPLGAEALEPFLARPGLEVVRFDPAMIGREADGRWHFSVPGRPGTPTAAVTLALPFDQRHLVGNVLAALTVYRALDLPLTRAQEGAARIRLSPGRGELHPLPGGGLVVNDAYNANPVSMRAAIRDLTERADGRRTVCILGEMAELGPASEQYHEEIAQALREERIAVVIAVGEAARSYLDPEANTWWAPDAAAVEPLLAHLRPGDAILVKASRSVGLEGIPALVENLLGRWSAS